MARSACPLSLSSCSVLQTDYVDHYKTHHPDIPIKYLPKNGTVCVKFCSRKWTSGGKCFALVMFENSFSTVRSPVMLMAGKLAIPGTGDRAIQFWATGRGSRKVTLRVCSNNPLNKQNAKKTEKIFPTGRRQSALTTFKENVGVAMSYDSRIPTNFFVSITDHGVQSNFGGAHRRAASRNPDAATEHLWQPLPTVPGDMMDSDFVAMLAPPEYRVLAPGEERTESKGSAQQPICDAGPILNPTVDETGVRQFLGMHILQDFPTPKGDRLLALKDLKDEEISEAFSAITVEEASQIVETYSDMIDAIVSLPTGAVPASLRNVGELSDYLFSSE